MNISTAREILGLGSEEDLRASHTDFQEARNLIAEMVRTAPNEPIADRYQKDLTEFDQALATLQEHLQASGLTAPPLPAHIVAQATKKTESPETVPAEKIAAHDGRWLSYFAWTIVLLTIPIGCGYIYFQSEKAKEEQRITRINFLERHGAILVENRRWQEAGNVYSEIELLAPDSPLVRQGRRNIDTGVIEEQNQFIGYWTGQSIAELEAGRLDEAVTAANEVIEKFPEENEAREILQRIAKARIDQARDASIAVAREALARQEWQAAANAAQKTLTSFPADPDASSIFADATASLAKAAADQARALELLEIAIARDNGQFDQIALDSLREAKSLAPLNPKITTYLEKLSSYTRTLRVPGDFATPAEALANARDQDRILLGVAAWKGPLVINSTVELQGAGFADTQIECPAEVGCPITIGPNGRKSRISGITFRHESITLGNDRFSAALVRGGSATFVDCRFIDASGHGLAVIEGGQATVSHCRFANNGWNGAAVIGRGSSLDVRDSEALNNFEHGIESWEGASVTLVNNRSEANSRNGIHIDNRDASAVITGNQLIANREFGLVLDSAGSGKVAENSARANLLGGVVIRSGAAKIPVTGNQVTLNQGPGLALEKNLSAASYAGNSISQNTDPQILTTADLSASDPPPQSAAAADPKNPKN